MRLGDKGSPLGKVMVPAQSKERELPPWTLPLKGKGLLNVHVMHLTMCYFKMCVK